MQDLKIFKNNEFGEIRTALVNNEPYFMLSDVCRVLEINNSRQAKTRLKTKGVITNDILTNGGKQQADFINESNLYKLVFQSRKPQAEKFSDWVTGEVLPAIRRDGMYMTDEKAYNLVTNKESFADLLELASKQLREKDIIIKEMQPKALFADSVTNSHTSILVGELAKILKQNGIEIGANRLFQWLRDNKYLISRKGTDYNMPTQYSMDLKLFEIKEGTYVNSDGSTKITKTPKVTGKGQIYFVNKFLNQEIA